MEKKLLGDKEEDIKIIKKDKIKLKEKEKEKEDEDDIDAEDKLF